MEIHDTRLQSSLENDLSNAVLPLDRIFTIKNQFHTGKLFARGLKLYKNYLSKNF